MIQVQSHNNNGLFRRKNYSKSRSKKKRQNRLFIRRSKIYDSLTNNSEFPSSTYDNNFTINYRPQSAQLRHKYVRQNLVHGAGDEQMTPPLNEQKHIDFTELEQIFDHAIRNRIPLELYKTKSSIQTNHYPESLPKLTANLPETRLELTNQSFIYPPVEEQKSNSIQRRKYRKILLGTTIVILSALIGFFTVFIFVK